VDDLATVRAQEYAKVFNELLGAADRLNMLRRLEGGSVDAHATAAMHAVRFAATILWPNVPNTPPPGYRHDSEGLLALFTRCDSACSRVWAAGRQRSVRYS
jgi:hypothetical protein